MEVMCNHHHGIILIPVDVMGYLPHISFSFTSLSRMAYVVPLLVTWPL